MKNELFIGQTRRAWGDVEDELTILRKIDGHTIIVSVDHSGDKPPIWAAWPEDLRGCIAEGDSLDAALYRLKHLIPAYKRTMERIRRKK